MVTRANIRYGEDESKNACYYASRTTGIRLFILLVPFSRAELKVLEHSRCVACSVTPSKILRIPMSPGPLSYNGIRKLSLFLLARG